MSEDTPKYYPIEGTVDYWMKKISQQLEETGEMLEEVKKIVKEGNRADKVV